MAEHLDDEPSKTVLSQKDAVTVDNSKLRDWEREREYLGGQLKGMEAIQDRFNATGEEGIPEAPDGNGRAIIANGNPDTAHHTAVYVPGKESNLSNIGGGINRMVDLWRTSHAFRPEAQISTVTWLGYEAPQDVVKDATFSHYANDAARDLNSFMDGLDTSHSPGFENHTTIVGHSYGTTVIGSAARQGDLNVDDVIFTGSPGVQVGRAEDIDVSSGHVWNQEVKGDLVPEIGQLHHGHREWSWETGADYITPKGNRFGANQMETDTHGHSDYRKVEEREDKKAGEKTRTPSLSSQNQAAVVIGAYDEVVRKGALDGDY